jgi:hypothetical protein
MVGFLNSLGSLVNEKWLTALKFQLTMLTYADTEGGSLVHTQTHSQILGRLWGPLTTPHFQRCGVEPKEYINKDGVEGPGRAWPT